MGGEAHAGMAIGAENILAKVGCGILPVALHVFFSDASSHTHTTFNIFSFITLIKV